MSNFPEVVVCVFPLPRFLRGKSNNARTVRYTHNTTCKIGASRGQRATNGDNPQDKDSFNEGKVLRVGAILSNVLLVKGVDRGIRKIRMASTWSGYKEAASSAVFPSANDEACGFQRKTERVSCLLTGLRKTAITGLPVTSPALNELPSLYNPAEVREKATINCKGFIPFM